MEKFIEKPVVINAEFWDGTNLDAIRHIVSPQKITMGEDSTILIHGCFIAQLKINSFLICHIDGSFEGMNRTVFFNKYQRVQADTPQPRERTNSAPRPRSEDDIPRHSGSTIDSSG